MDNTENSTKNSLTTTVLFLIVLCSILLVELIGNILVLVVVYRQRRNVRQRITNTLLANLAFIDLLVPTFLIPFSLAVLIEGKQILTFAICQVNGFFTNVVGSASILTMAVIGIDRYLAIASPSGRRLQLRQVLFLLCGVWLISIIISLLPILFWGNYTATEKSVTCKPASGGFLLLLSSVCFVIPFVIMVYCYTKVFIKVQRHKRLLLGSLKRESRGIKTEFQTTKIVLVVLTVFVVAWLPFVVVYVVSSNGKDMEIPTAVFQFCGLLTAAHSMCNPIIYLAMNKSFRRDAFALIPCLKRFGNTEIGCESQGQQSSLRNANSNRLSSTATRKESANNIEVIALD